MGRHTTPEELDKEFDWLAHVAEKLPAAFQGRISWLRKSVLDMVIELEAELLPYKMREEGKEVCECGEWDYPENMTHYEDATLCRKCEEVPDRMDPGLRQRVIDVANNGEEGVGNG